MTIPIHLFGAYCIMFKTPPTMNSIKWNLLNCHFWISFVDVMISLLTTPYLLIPTLSGYPLGILKTLGVGTNEQVFFAMSTLGTLGVSMIHLFEARLLSFIDHRHWWRKVRVPCFCSLALEIFWSTVITKFVLDQQITKNVSRNTMRMQRKFQRALYFQVLIPFAVITVPATYLASSIVFGYHFQYLNNISVIFVSFHGILSTIAMLSAHAPFREYTLSLFRVRIVRKTETGSFARVGNFVCSGPTS
ncbi:hypothetical protein GCK72_020075 [Caenorhabditis remanei]|uniref:Uncharacterized protein n=1 Tax=Caenorhabditis remanei TaxID=31234 RepID=A0A6A5GED0_CAERE|nr:hypothetical protein GCK72_020075 [Caenorhabditis remanei]KAF1753518.1 hypothetical protein GCK72_020075 [Caenorhabditis remanei]